MLHHDRLGSSGHKALCACGQSCLHRAASPFPQHRLFTPACAAAAPELRVRIPGERDRRRRHCRNWRALDAVELVPRYGITTVLPRSISSCSESATPLQSVSPPWAAPRSSGPAPTSTLPPPPSGHECPIHWARGRNDRRARCGDSRLTWSGFRLPFFRNQHAIGYDLVRRADAAGVHVLMLTLDVPVRTTRAREVAAGVTSPFRPDLRMACGILACPAYLTSLWRHGQPRFGNLKPYTASTANIKHRDDGSPGDGGRLHMGRDRQLSRPVETSARRRGCCIRPMQRNAWRFRSTGSSCRRRAAGGGAAGDN